jgi:peroxiredoxin
MAYDPSVHPLDTCDQLPAMSFATLDHGTISVPAVFGDRWGVVLLYRGVWCGYCRRQLADFQRALGEIEARNALVVAASVDSADDARKMVEHGGLTFPVGYGLDAKAIAAQTGCSYEATDLFLQKTAFVVRPGGEIARANYSSGPTGALTPADTIQSLDFFQKNPEHRTGILRRPAATV